MDAVRKGREMKGRMTESQAIDFLMERKGKVLAATGWEGFLAAGKGFLVTDGQSVSFMPLSLVGRFQTHIRRRLLPLVKSYVPATQIVVALLVPLDPATIVIALGTRMPALAPEEAFLQYTGTPALPPMQTVFHAPQPGKRAAA
jgi:hypothetical protein